MDQRKPASLAAFFVYNPLFGPTDETEHEKLLFYYPPDVGLDQKLKYVGLSEALVNFSRYRFISVLKMLVPWWKLLARDFA